MEPEANDSERRRSMLIKWGAIIGGILIGIIALVLIILIATHHKEHREQMCGLDLKLPENFGDTIPIASRDYHSLVNMSAYILMLEPPSGFLKVNLTDTVRLNDKIDVTKSKLSLIFDCAKMTFDINVINWRYDIRHMSLSIKQKYDYIKVCDANISINVPIKNYYSCLGRQVFNCWAKFEDANGTIYAKPIAEIVLNRFEFELDGDPAKIRAGIFSKNLMSPSCPQPLIQ